MDPPAHAGGTDFLTFRLTLPPEGLRRGLEPTSPRLSFGRLSAQGRCVARADRLSMVSWSLKARSSSMPCHQTRRSPERCWSLQFAPAQWLAETGPRMLPGRAWADVAHG